MIGPKNAHRPTAMDQNYLVEGIYTPPKLAEHVTLEEAIVKDLVLVNPNELRSPDGTRWQRRGDKFMRVAAPEPPSPDEKDEREEPEEDDLAAGFDETAGEEDPLPETDIPGTVEEPLREMNNEPVPPPQGNDLEMSPIGPTHSNEVLVFQTYMPGQTPKPTLKERVTEHAQEGAELRQELCELVEDVGEVLELAQGCPAEPSDELTVVLSTPTYVNPLVPEQSNDPMSPTFALYAQQKQAVDADDIDDTPPDSEQAARDAAREAFHATMQAQGDADAAHNAAYEAAFNALTPFVTDPVKTEELAQAIVSDMRTAPKLSMQKQADDVADPDYDYDQMTGTGGHAPYNQNVHADAELNVDEKLNLVLRELEEVEEAIGVNESPEEEAAEENEARAAEPAEESPAGE